MEKAVIKTLIYAEIFNYPLKINEIHKWLIGRKATLRQVEKALEKLKKVKKSGDYYFLKANGSRIRQRKISELCSDRYLRKARLIAQLLKIIPWIKLTGISGGLAVNNADKSDDIDFFIITAKKRIYLCRILILGLLSLLGQRRKRAGKAGENAGKICVNILLEDDKLEQSNKDIFIAHEILQMKVLWQKDGIYSKYLEDNSWVFKFLPNWVGNIKNSNHFCKSKNIRRNSLLDYAEKLAEKFQLWYMKKPQGLERIDDGALYFHPQDCRLRVLSGYKKRLKKCL